MLGRHGRYEIFKYWKVRQLLVLIKLCGTNFRWTDCIVFDKVLIRLPLRFETSRMNFILSLLSLISNQKSNVLRRSASLLSSRFWRILWQMCQYLTFLVFYLIETTQKVESFAMKPFQSTLNVEKHHFQKKTKVPKVTWANVSSWILNMFLSKETGCVPSIKVSTDNFGLAWVPSILISGVAFFAEKIW